MEGGGKETEEEEEAAAEICLKGQAGGQGKERRKREEEEEERGGLRSSILRNGERERGGDRRRTGGVSPALSSKELWDLLLVLDDRMYSVSGRMRRGGDCSLERGGKRTKKCRRKGRTETKVTTHNWRHAQTAGRMADPTQRGEGNNMSSYTVAFASLHTFWNVERRLAFWGGAENADGKGRGGHWPV